MHGGVTGKAGDSLPMSILTATHCDINRSFPYVLQNHRSDSKLKWEDLHEE